jgi:hypothetical protein
MGGFRFMPRPCRTDAVRLNMFKDLSAGTAWIAVSLPARPPMYQIDGEMDGPVRDSLRRFLG